MPETTMHEYHCSVFRQNDIRAAWQITTIYTKAKTQRMYQLSYKNFRLSMRSFHRAHDTTSYLALKLSHHTS